MLEKAIPGRPSASVKKFGLIGTSCAGKTSLAYRLLDVLKHAGVNADGVLQQDRRFSFDRALLDTDPVAQWSFIANQIKAEADMMLKPGVDVLICDRSPLDFYAYYHWQYGLSQGLLDCCVEWVSRTYTKMYLLDALPYQDDGARLNEEGRDSADKVVRAMAQYAKDKGAKIVTVSDTDPTADMTRKAVLAEILFSVSRVLQENELRMLPAAAGVQHLLVGGSYAYNRAKKSSDLDVYLCTTEPKETGHPELAAYQQRLKDVYGVQVEVRGVVAEVYRFLRDEQGFKEYKAS